MEIETTEIRASGTLNALTTAAAEIQSDFADCV
jgi:hypothetical protein